MIYKAQISATVKWRTFETACNILSSHPPLYDNLRHCVDPHWLQIEWSQELHLRSWVRLETCTRTCWTAPVRSSFLPCERLVQCPAHKSSRRKPGGPQPTCECDQLGRRWQCNAGCQSWAVFEFLCQPTSSVSLRDTELSAILHELTTRAFTIHRFVFPYSFHPYIPEPTICSLRSRWQSSQCKPLILSPFSLRLMICS